MHCQRLAHPSTRRPTQLPLSRKPLVIRATRSDHSIRVPGDVRRVFTYVSDFGNVQSWMPGVSSVYKGRGAGQPLGVRSQFQVEQTIGGINVSTLYEVADLQQDKSVVYRASSEMHKGTEQLIFMPDPNNRSFTMVRYISTVELTDWRRALQPVLSGVLNKIPEDSLNNLHKLLNSPNTPLRNIQVDMKSERRTARSKAAQTSSGWPFANMFASLKKEMGDNVLGRQLSHVTQPQPEIDALGFYEALGLDAKRRSALSPDDVKSAFRKLAITMHPDKFTNSDDEDVRNEAEESFRKVQRAYEVLRDPEQKLLYDEGKLQLEEQSVL